MNEPNSKARELEAMLLSGEIEQIKRALLEVNQDKNWQSLIKDSIPCPNSFFETHFSKLLVSLKIWLTQPDHSQLLQQKGLSFILKKLWRKYVATFLTDTDLLQMFRANNTSTGLAMEICFQRFYTKIHATLMKTKPDEEAVKEILQNTFLKVFERFKRADASFQLSSNLEAYFTQSCKHAYWKFWNKEGVDFEEIENSKEVAVLANEDAQIDDERAKCFEEKVFTKLGETCKNILGMAYLGYKNPEIATRFDYSLGYVKKKKSECLSKAKELAKNNCGDF